MNRGQRGCLRGASDCLIHSSIRCNTARGIAITVVSGVIFPRCMREGRSGWENRRRRATDTRQKKSLRAGSAIPMALLLHYSRRCHCCFEPNSLTRLSSLHRRDRCCTCCDRSIGMRSGATIGGPDFSVLAGLAEAARRSAIAGRTRSHSNQRVPIRGRCIGLQVWHVARCVDWFRPSSVRFAVRPYAARPLGSRCCTALSARQRRYSPLITHRFLWVH